MLAGERARPRAHPREREAAGPRAPPEPAEDAAGPLQELVSTSATARSAALSRAARARGSCRAARSTRVSSRRSTRRAAAGTALDRGVAERLSPSLGDLSDVRVHTDQTVARAQPRRLGAGFATGTDVYFAQDQYKPNTTDGDRLIAHELAHVVQQRGAPTSGPLTVSNPGDAMEREADDVADSYCRHPVTSVIRRSGRISFGFIDRRVMAAVERVAGSDPDPGDPFRGLYISDEVALRLTQGESRVGRRRAPAGGHRGARARPARGRGARGLRRDRAQPALRAPVRVPPGRRHAQAPEPAPRRAAAGGRGSVVRRRDGRVRRATGGCAASAR